MSSYNPPIENAIPTIYGWAHPITGELLVSIKGLENPVEGYKRNRPWTQPEKAPVVAKSIVHEEQQAETVQKQKPKRGKD